MFRMKAYEQEHGPHFNEEHARKAVSKMENEDGTRGPHWSIEETTSLANQYGVSLNNKFNRYDWFVALNMIYSDYYRVMINISNSNSPKNYVEFAKAWMNDKDIDEGKMWYYYMYVMCDKIREEEIANIIRNQYNIYRTRKESIAKCDEEMEKCQVILNKLNIADTPKQEDNTIKEMQKQINQLRQIIEDSKRTNQVQQTEMANQ